MFSQRTCSTLHSLKKETLRKTWPFFTVFLFFHVDVAESRICTRMTVEKQFKVDKIKTTCVQPFEDKCCWFCVKRCTYNETVECIKEQNRTVTVYRIIEDCCPGYSRNAEGQCIPELNIEQNDRITTEAVVKQETANKTSTQNEEYGFATGNSTAHNSFHGSSREGGKIYLGLSHGAYAGIVCGVLFVACVTLLTMMHYQKRKRRQKKGDNAMTQLDTTQTQQMLPMGKLSTSVQS